MWPWDHLMVGYVLYSIYARFRLSRSPTGRTVAVVFLTTLLPDLVDKTLSWQLGMLPSGRSLAHSLLVAVPLTVSVLVAARAVRRPDVGAAFGLGYLSHVAADAIYPAIIGDGTDLTFLLWPVTDIDPIEVQDPIERTMELLVEFAGFLSDGAAWRFVAVEVTLVGLTLWLWLSDGMPGIRPFLSETRDRSLADRR